METACANSTFHMVNLCIAINRRLAYRPDIAFLASIPRIAALPLVLLRAHEEKVSNSSSTSLVHEPQRV